MPIYVAYSAVQTRCFTKILHIIFTEMHLRVNTQLETDIKPSGCAQNHNRMKDVKLPQSQIYRIAAWPTRINYK